MPIQLQLTKIVEQHSGTQCKTLELLEDRIQLAITLLEYMSSTIRVPMHRIFKINTDIYKQDKLEELLMLLLVLVMAVLVFKPKITRLMQIKIPLQLIRVEVKNSFSNTFNSNRTKQPNWLRPMLLHTKLKNTREEMRLNQIRAAWINKTNFAQREAI